MNSYSTQEFDVQFLLSIDLLSNLLKKISIYSHFLFRYWKTSSLSPTLLYDRDVFSSSHADVLTDLSRGRGFCLSSSRFEIYRAHGASLFICSPMASIFGNGLKGRSWYGGDVRFYSCDADKNLLVILLERRRYFHRQREKRSKLHRRSDRFHIYFVAH